MELHDVLKGRRVVEIARGLAGQHCGYALAGLGASVHVLKFDDEPGRPLDEHKLPFHADIGTPEGFAALVRCCEGADVLIEERPASGWPAGGPLFERLLKHHPRLVVACLTPFGLSGPHADYAAHALNSYHACGMGQQIPCDPLRPQDRERPPLQAGGHWGEAQAGTQAALTVLAHLLGPRPHRGAVLDCSTQEALISFFWTEVARFPNEHRSPTRLAPLATIVGGVLPARDGFVQVAVREDAQWRALAGLLQHPEWAVDERWATRAARSSRCAEVARLLASETGKLEKLELHTRGRAMGIPIAAVLSPEALLVDPDLASRGAWRQGADSRLKWPLWAACVSSPPGTNQPLTDDPNAVVFAPGSHAPRGGARRGQGTVVSTSPQRGEGRDEPLIEESVSNGNQAPLAGLRVIDLGWVAMGPYAGYALAGLGAQVIHVAKPQRGPVAGVDLASYNYGFDTLNTGKTWVGLDLKSGHGRELLLELVGQCDVVLSNFRPGVMRRLGLGYDDLRTVNPRLVMLSASTYGEAGMDGAYVGYAPVFSALGGLAHFTGYPEGPPAEVSHPVDFFAGLVGVMGIVAGLHKRAATGSGCHIDLAAREAILWSLSGVMAQAQSGTGARRWGNGHPAMAPHGVYPCRGENRWISIAVGSDDEWRRLCDCMGRREWTLDPQIARAAGRLASRTHIDAAIEQWTRTCDAPELAARLQRAGVAAFPSVTGEDLWNDDHLHARGVFASRRAGDQERWYVAPAWRLRGCDRTALNTVTGDAAIEAVFGDLLGLNRSQLDTLLAQGVIAPRH